jgi:hypothetical protein
VLCFFFMSLVPPELKKAPIEGANTVKVLSTLWVPV